MGKKIIEKGWLYEYEETAESQIINGYEVTGVRICSSREYAIRLENRIKKNLPQEGNVRLLCVTEKQYEDMKLLVGSRQTAETAIGTERLIVI